MQIDWIALVTLAVAVSGAVLGWAARKTARERLATLASQEADAKLAIAQAGESAAQSVQLLLPQLNARITELATQLLEARTTISELQTALAARDVKEKQMQVEIDELRGGVMVLIAQLEENGIRPRWKPKTGPIGQKSGAG